MSSKIFVKRTNVVSPRLPLEGYLDITYRCNNNCLHCWLYEPDTKKIAKNELSLVEIKRIVADARAMGCRTWTISGGEPMLRQDFLEIMEHIIENSVYYSLNTNGSLVTPEIAKTLKKKGNKWVALYGATEKIHDHITRRPGSYEQTMRGMALLKEAGAHFIVQIVPMKDNYFQVKDMVDLAESLGYPWRTNRTWFYLSASGSAKKNKEIEAQRLSAEQLITLEDIGVPRAEKKIKGVVPGDYRLLASCIGGKKDFHVDSYGKISFCSMAKDSTLRYDLRAGTFEEAWGKFIPSLADKITGGDEYEKNCGSCEMKGFCDWCPLYSYLESGSYQTKILSLCECASRKKELKKIKERDYQRFYQLAGLTVQVEADVPLTDTTFDRRFREFEIETPGEDLVVIKHRIGLPEIDWSNPGEPVYVKRPWAVYRKNDAYVYCMDVIPEEQVFTPSRVAVVNLQHTRMNIYHRTADCFSVGKFPSITMFPTDVILLGHTLAHKQGFWLHSSGMAMEGRGLLFVGQSGAGKSTMVKLLKDKALILCDERNVVRRWPDKLRIHGTWSHGEIPIVHPYEAPLAGIFFLEKASENYAVRMTDKVEACRRIIQCLIRPVETNEWWTLSIDMIRKMLDEVPVYRLYFTPDDRVVKLVESLLEDELRTR